MLYLLVIFLFSVAFLYSSVGHGGASGYLAILSLFGYQVIELRSSVLLLNVIVSLIAFIQFYRVGFFNWKLFLPFAVSSVPSAFVGALINPEIYIYKLGLAVFLLLASIRMVMKIHDTDSEEKGQCAKGQMGKRVNGEWIKKNLFVLSIIIGIFLGFFSGLIGIGGGIILSPLLVLVYKTKVKESAGVSSLFIFVNSIAGIAGLFQNKFSPPESLVFWIMAASLGGLFGSYFGAKHFKTRWLRYILAFVLIFAAGKLIFV